MDWPGVRADLSVVSKDGLLTAKNVSFKIGEELRRRPGLGGTRINETGLSVTEFQQQLQGTYLIYFGTGGTLKSVNLSTAAEVTLKSSLNTAYKGSTAKSNGRLYFVNDFDVMQVIERGDVTGATAGISAPTATIGSPSASGGSCTSGTHLIRYRYYNSKSLYISNPSPALSYTATGSVDLTFSIGTGTGSEAIIRSTDPKVDQVIIEMSAAGASTYYRAKTVNQALTGATVSLADATLTLLDLTSIYGDFGHEPPPLFKLITECRGRLFGWGATAYSLTGGVAATLSGTSITNTGTAFSPNWAGRLLQVGGDTQTYRITSGSTSSLTISTNYSGTSVTGAALKVVSGAPYTLTWSRAGFPESWKPSDWARRVLMNDGDIPTGMVCHHDVMWLFGKITMCMLDYTADPATGKVYLIPTEMGLWNQDCLVKAGGKIFGWGPSGVWTIDGMLPQHLSSPIDEAIDGSDASSALNYNSDNCDNFFANYDPKERCISWYYTTAATGYPQNAIVYSLDTGKWSTRTFRQAIRCGCLTTRGQSNVQALVADDNGYSWTLTADAFDGVPVSLSGGVVTVSTTGATTTVIPVSGTTLSTSPDLAGIVVYNPSTSGSAVIASNTATAFTLASALTAAPSIGDALYFGSFEAQIRTKWVSAQGMDYKQRPTWLSVKKVPNTSTGTLNVKVYLDFSTTAHVYETNISDTWPDGITLTNGGSTVVVDLDGGSGDGVAYVPMPAEWNRVISAEVTQIKPLGTLQLLEVSFITDDQKNMVKQDGE